MALSSARVIALAALLAALCAFAPAAAAKMRVALDTDIGTDFDDTMALLYLLSRSDVVDLVLIQCSTYNTTQRAQIVGTILTAVGRADIPLAVGYAGPQGPMPQYSIAKNFDLAAYPNVSYGTGVLEALMATATAADPLYVVEIAPATSLFTAIVTTRATAHVVPLAMSGSVYVGYGNSSTPSAEYNVVQDIEASQYVYNSTWLSPLATAPLDTTIFQQWTGPVWAKFLAVANATQARYASTLLANYNAWYAGGGKSYYALLPFSPAVGTSTMYDAQAAWMAPYYAQQLQTHVSAGGSPTSFALSFPYLLSPSLPLTVTGSGYTVLNSTLGHSVFAAVGFNGTTAYEATAFIGTEILAAILSAG